MINGNEVGVRPQQLTFFQEICRTGFPLRRLMALTPLDMLLLG